MSKVTRSTLLIFVTCSYPRVRKQVFFMCDADSLDALQGILYSLQSEKYEPGGYFTIGGTAGTYQIKSPFNTECEFTLVSVSTSAATGASFAFSSSNPAILAPTITTQYGLSSQGSESSNQFDGIAGFVTPSSQNVYAGIWVPLSRGAYIYLNVAPGASNVIHATIAFRRAYMHAIPNVPRQNAGTHSLVQSRRGLRVVPQASKQMSGFAAQYPDLEGNREYYDHSEQPYQEDPANLNPMTRNMTGIRGRGNR